jgi:hypothetical protein
MLAAASVKRSARARDPGAGGAGVLIWGSLGHLRQQAQMAAYQDTFLMLCGVTSWLRSRLLARQRVHLQRQARQWAVKGLDSVLTPVW